MAVEVNARVPEQSSEDSTPQNAGSFWERGDWPRILPDTVFDHLHFYRDNANSSRRIARLLDGAIIVISAAIPVMAAARVHQAILGGLGALVTVLAAMGHQFS